MLYLFGKQKDMSLLVPLLRTKNIEHIVIQGIGEGGAGAIQMPKLENDDLAVYFGPKKQFQSFSDVFKSKSYQIGIGISAEILEDLTKELVKRISTVDPVKVAKQLNPSKIQYIVDNADQTFELELEKGAQVRVVPKREMVGAGDVFVGDIVLLYILLDRIDNVTSCKLVSNS